MPALHNEISYYLKEELGRNPATVLVIGKDKEYFFWLIRFICSAYTLEKVFFVVD